MLTRSTRSSHALWRDAPPTEPASFAPPRRCRRLAGVPHRCCVTPPPCVAPNTLLHPVPWALPPQRRRQRPARGPARGCALAPAAPAGAGSEEAAPAAPPPLAPLSLATPRGRSVALVACFAFADLFACACARGCDTASSSDFPPFFQIPLCSPCSPSSPPSSARPTRPRACSSRPSRWRRCSPPPPWGVCPMHTDASLCSCSQPWVRAASCGMRHEAFPCFSLEIPFPYRPIFTSNSFPFGSHARPPQARLWAFF